ncbi:hypothetical protein T492DRAFT_437988 [Pavlovales sp. CCMP2436]|nr:hypothetical protein T492DRAFT_437988 [Pavlovales sp. CCMP2436]
MPRPGAGATTTSSATLPTKLLSLLLLLLALLLPAAVGLAVVSSVVVSGLPVGSPASFALLGTDLAQPGGVQCSYAAASGMFLAAGTVNSATGAECNVPSAAGAGSYTLTLLYGNVAASNYFEPVVVVLYGPSAFSLVGLYPAGGPAGGGTTVTLTGAGACANIYKNVRPRKRPLRLPVVQQQHTVSLRPFPSTRDPLKFGI